MKIHPHITQRLAVIALWTLTVSTLGVLLFIIAYILGHGLPHVTWSFLSESPRSMGREGGVLPMIIGTIFVTGLAVALAAPIGVATAVYLTEYTREGRLTAIIRFGADCLAGSLRSSSACSGSSSSPSISEWASRSSRAR